MSQKTSHTVALASAYPTPSQMTEFYALVAKRIITRSSLQDFMRGRLVPRSYRLESQSPPVGKEDAYCAECLIKAEAACREHHPDIVNEVMELLAPFCSSALDLEFKSPHNPDHNETAKRDEERELSNKVTKTIFWMEIESVVFDHLSLPHHPEDPPRQLYQGIDENIQNLVFIKEISTRRLLNAKFSVGAKEILAASEISEYLMSGLLYRKFEKTAARKYNLVAPREVRTVVKSIDWSLKMSISFLAAGDTERARAFMPFLEFQRSGTPVYNIYQNTAYVLCV